MGRWDSKEWKDNRERVLKKNKRCMGCGSEENLVIHHPKKGYNSYVHYEYLNMEDVIVLCRRCHYLEHLPPLTSDI